MTENSELAPSPSAPPALEIDPGWKPTDVAMLDPRYVAILADRPPPPGIHATTWVYAQCLFDVHSWGVEHHTVNVFRACEETGWPRGTYYRARQDPQAAELSKGYMMTMQAAGALMIQHRLLGVVHNMLDIAESQAGVAAVRAASWVREYLKDHEDVLDDLIEEGKDEKRGEKSAAALMMEQFPGARKLVEKTVTTKETTIEDEAIDVTPS